MNNKYWLSIGTLVCLGALLSNTLAWKSPEIEKTHRSSTAAAASDNPFKRGFRGMKRVSAGDFNDVMGSQPMLNKLPGKKWDAGDSAAYRFNRHLAKFGAEVRITRIQEDRLGNRHIRMKEYINQMAVIGSDIIVHINKDNEIYHVSGTFSPFSIKQSSALLNRASAIAMAKRCFPSDSVQIGGEASLVVFDSTVAYEITVILTEPQPQRWKLFIDAKSGILLGQLDQLLRAAPGQQGAHGPITGNRITGEDGSLVTFEGWHDTNGNYFLYHKNELWGVYNLDTPDWEQRSTPFWGTSDPSAISLANNFSITQKFVVGKLGRNSFDDLGTLAQANVHEGINYINAYWDGTDFHFGDGDNSQVGPLTTLDISAHEYGHAITQYTSDLAYSYESGALNESYSDILGTWVEFSAQPDGRSAYPHGTDGYADWLCGEDCWLGDDALRDLRDPLRYSSPSYYQGTHWYTGSGDNGGVHYNSGVQNKAFYLLAEGGSGSNDGHPYTLVGMGVDSAGQIAMYANMFLLTSSSQYRDARNAWIQAAVTLGYDAVGVGDAWAAVGVLPLVKHLDALPVNLAFDSVGVGVTDTMVVLLSNNGGDATLVSSLAFSNPAFSAATMVPFMVAGGASLPLRVVFTPPSYGAATGNLTITSNAEDNPSLTVSLSGTGVAPAVMVTTPQSLTRTLFAGDSTTAVVTINNSGEAKLRWSITEIDMTLVAVAPHTYDVSHFLGFEKGAADTRTGIAVTAQQGGPDNSGYTWIDSDDPAGPVYQWNDISTSGTLLSSISGCDDCFQLQWLSFEFPFYGNRFDTIFVSSNGFITLGSGSSQITNYPLPSTSAPANLIAALHDDLYPSGGGDIYFKDYGDRAVVQFDNVYHYSGSGMYTFQIVLENSGAIRLYYNNLTGPLTRCTVGIQNGTGDDGLTVVYNATYLKSLLAVKFSPRVNWFAATPHSGTLSAGQSALVDVAFNGAAVAGGTCYGRLDIAHNAPGTPSPQAIPCTLWVNGIRRLAAAPLSLDFGTHWVGARDTATVTLTNRGDEVTIVSSVNSSNPAFAGITLFPLAVPAFGTAELRVEYLPGSVGNHSGTFIINSNAEDNPVLAVSFTGSGVDAPQISVSPAFLSQVLDPDDSVSSTISVANTGGAALQYQVKVAASGTSAGSFSAPVQKYRLSERSVSVPQNPDNSLSGENAAVTAKAMEVLAADLGGVTVLYDTYHGERDTFNESILVSDIVQRGAKVVVNTKPITAALLDTIDILWIDDDGSTTFSAAESTVVVGWIRSGGSLFTHCDEPEFFQKIVHPFGITFGGGYANGTTTNIVAHAVTESVSQVYLSGPMTACMVSGNAQIVVRDPGNYGHTCVVEAGAGRIVTVVDDDFYNTEITYADNRLFGNNIIDWLAQRRTGSWLSTTATSGSIVAGGIEMLPVKFSTKGLMGGQYTGYIEISHNVPSQTTPVSVPCTLQVNRLRSLSVSPHSLTYPLQWVGSQDTAIVTLTNTGNEATQVNSIVSSHAAFSVVAPSPLQVLPFDSMKILVVFHPVSVGNYSCVLTINSTAEDNPLLTVAVSGQGGLGPSISTSPESIHRYFTDNQVQRDSLIIENTGYDILNYSVSLSLQQLHNPLVDAAVLERHAANTLQGLPASVSVRQLYGDIVPQEGLPVNKSSGEPFSVTVPHAKPTPHGILEWEQLAPMSIARGQYGIAVLPTGKVYIAGGYAGNSEFNSLEIYDIASNTWTRGADMPSPDRGMASAVDDSGNIYCFAAIEETSYKYNPRNDSWTIIPSPSSSPWEAAAVKGYDGRIYLFGGAGALDAVNIYNPQSNSWTTGASIPTSRMQHGAAVGPGGLIYIIGGRSSLSSVSGVVEIYNPQSNSWSAGAPMPTPRNSFAIAYGADNKIYVIGGKDNYTNNSGPFFNVTEIYDPLTNTWETGDTLATGLAEMDAVAFNGKIYLFGGTSGTFTSATQSIGAVAWFSCTPTSGIVAAGQTATVQLQFDISGLFGGEYTAQLAIGHNAPNERSPVSVPCTVTVDGIRRLVSEQSSISYPATWIGSGRSSVVSLQNTGTETTVVSAVASNNPSFVGTIDLPVSIQPGGLLTFGILFQPVTQGVQSGVVTIESNAEDNPVLLISLSGTGVIGPNASINPDSLYYALLPSDIPETQVSCLHNSGEDTLVYSIASVNQLSGPPVQAPAAQKTVPEVHGNLIYGSNNYLNPFVNGRVIVGMAPSVSALSKSTLDAVGAVKFREIGVARNPATGLAVNTTRKALLVTLADTSSQAVIAAISILKDDPAVVYAEPDYMVRVIAIPNDPSFSHLYEMYNIGQSGGTVGADIDATDVWDAHTGGRNIRIGIIDTGIDYLHPDLAANIWTNPGEIGGNGVDDDGNGYVDDVHGWDFVNGDGDPMDDHYHGTHSAGTIAGVGNNGIGVAGVMRSASLVGLKFLDAGGCGTTSAAIEAVTYANAMGIEITSNSWGGGGFSQALMDAIALGGLFVAAAGNSGSSNDAAPQYPATYALDNIIAVAATDRNDLKAPFSCYGRATVDLGAPGVEIYSCAPGGAYQTLSGTSIATPQVSGAAGLVWSYNSSLTALQVKSLLLDNVDPVSSMANITVTGGRLNVNKALAAAGPSWLAASPMAGGKIAPNDSAVIEVSVDPEGLEAGRWSGSVVVATNDPARSQLPINVVADIAGCRSLRSSVDELRFGTLISGSRDTLELTLNNLCTAPVTVGAISSSDTAFVSLASTPFTVAANGAVAVKIVFGPYRPTLYTGVLTISSNADDNPALAVALYGTSIAGSEIVVTPQMITADVPAGGSVQRTLAIANRGDAPLMWSIGYTGGGILSQGISDTIPGVQQRAYTCNHDLTSIYWTDAGNDAFDGFGYPSVKVGADSIVVSMLEGQTSYSSNEYGFTVRNDFAENHIYRMIIEPQAGANSNRSDISVDLFGNLGSDGNETVRLDSVRVGTTWLRFYISTDSNYPDSDPRVVFMIVPSQANDRGNVSYWQPTTGNLAMRASNIALPATVYIIPSYHAIDSIRSWLQKDLRSSAGWLASAADTGSVAGGGESSVQLTLDAAGLEAGVYTDTLRIAHNAPYPAGPVSVPVIFTVGGVMPGSMSCTILSIGPAATTSVAGNTYSVGGLTIGTGVAGRAQGSSYRVRFW